VRLDAPEPSRASASDAGGRIALAAPKFLARWAGRMLEGR
jgi:hypothetical protein